MDYSLIIQCPGCLANVWSLWCESICSPFQQSFMVPTETISQTLQVIKIDFILHPDFAQGLYESCSSIKTENGKTFSSLYSDKQSFLNGVLSDNPQYKINFVFNTTGYNSDITPCSGPEKTTTSPMDSTSSAQSKHFIHLYFIKVEYCLDKVCTPRIQRGKNCSFEGHGDPCSHPLTCQLTYANEKEVGTCQNNFQNALGSACYSDEYCNINDGLYVCILNYNDDVCTQFQRCGCDGKCTEWFSPKSTQKDILLPLYDCFNEHN
ncbi:hypothetical protein ACTFIY_009882 [Dictyostelium cf. discoideum]